MAKLAIQPGSTSVSVDVLILDSSVSTGAGKTGIAFNTSGLIAYYHRPGANSVAITLATQTVTGAYSSGGFVEIDSTNMPGLYRLDVPDAAFATGARFVMIRLQGVTNMTQATLEIDLSNESRLANGVTHGGNTAVLLLEHANVTCTTTNTPGLYIGGTGSSPALQLQGGITGNGVTMQGGSTSGHGMHLVGGAIGAGLRLQGGSSSGDGLLATTTSGNGFTLTPSGSNKTGISAAGSGTGAGVTFTGGATGSGLSLVGGATSGNALSTSVTVPSGPIAELGVVDIGTAQAADAFSITLRSGFSANAVNMIGLTAFIFSSTNGKFSRGVSTAYNDSTKVLSLDNLGEAPTGTIQYAILATPQGSTTNPVPASITNGQDRYQKNAAAPNIPFIFVDSTDHVTRKTGITVTATRSIDGAAFGAVTGTVAEISNGVYELSASQADMNGNNIVFRFTGSACDPVELHIKTYT